MDDKLTVGIAILVGAFVLSIPAVLILRAALKLGSLIFRNLTRNRRRTILTLASSAVSLGLLALIVAMYQSFFYGDDASPSEARRLITRHKVSLIQPLPTSYMSEIQQIPGVEKGTDGQGLVSAWSWFQGTYIDSRNFFARFAVDAPMVFKIHQDWEMLGSTPAAAKEHLARFEDMHDPQACAVAESIAKKYNFKVSDDPNVPPQEITLMGDIYPVDLKLKIVGIFRGPQASECLVFHREYLTHLLEEKSKDNPQANTVGTYLILADSAEHVPAIASRIDEHFREHSDPTRTESEKEFGRSFLAFLGNIKVFLAAICGAVTFTIMLVSANAVAMAVRERTREVAILRTLGYRPGEVLQLILGESIVVSLVGGVLGLGIGYVLSLVVQAGGALFGFQGLKWQGAVIVLVAALLVGMVSALGPALVAVRKNVVESLRFTG